MQDIIANMSNLIRFISKESQAMNEQVEERPH